VVVPEARSFVLGPHPSVFNPYHAGLVLLPRSGPPHSAAESVSLNNDVIEDPSFTFSQPFLFGFRMRNDAPLEINQPMPLAISEIFESPPLSI